MSKHMLMLKDASLYEIIAFLDAADQHGHNIPTQIGPQVWKLHIGFKLGVSIGRLLEK